MNEIVRIEQQVQILCGLSQEEGFHTVFFSMIPNIFNLQQNAMRMKQNYKLYFRETTRLSDFA
jgi:hypothetical protein